VRAPLVVSEPATIANTPSLATSPREGRSASGSSSPLCRLLLEASAKQKKVGREPVPGDRISLFY
jgi:hypothetical protein